MPQIQKRYAVDLLEIAFSCLTIFVLNATESALDKNACVDLPHLRAVFYSYIVLVPLWALFAVLRFLIPALAQRRACKRRLGDKLSTFRVDIGKDCPLIWLNVVVLGLTTLYITTWTSMFYASYGQFVGPFFI